MLEMFSVSLFGKDRKIRVYLPKSYQHGLSRRYPVLYLHDGQNVFGNEEAINGVSLQLHQYLDDQELDLLVVAIDQNTEGEERVNEYCPWKNGDFTEKLIGSIPTSGGKGKEYVKFIVGNLKPHIDHTYRTNPEEAYMAGISLGGLISTYAACSYPHIFKRVAAISAAYYRNQEEIENIITKSDLSSLEKIYLDCGTAEAGENERVSELFLDSNQTVFHLLKTKVKQTEFRKIEGALHNYETFKRRFPDVIKFLTSET
ncbi:alpha/beta hydrolase-fold protein [Mesobacillus maritimus]|uniref:alpha/beta hydrolase n=1 Tax=Mesobacillus maritimus TaxID=1643336 RepID=UPI00203E1B48|nr:alpha/beta hydrolase-fold protein [Mesobacillus maritimus]MCM3670439.1 alpha/beta hydrolase-fold protein [Mesobacillus maritimus]